MNKSLSFWALVFVALIFVCLFSYESGYSYGTLKGYQDGEADAWSYYPQMSTDSIMITSDKATVELNGVTVIGEENLLDLIRGETDFLVSWGNTDEIP